MLKYLIPAILLAVPALAQQQQASPAETALQINAVIGQWASTITQQGKVIEDLQKQIAAAQARVKELEQRKE